MVYVGYRKDAYRLKLDRSSNLPFHWESQEEILERPLVLESLIGEMDAYQEESS